MSSRETTSLVSESTFCCFNRLPVFRLIRLKLTFFAERGGRIERNGARDQRKPKIALPVRTRRHWILLNNTRRANYTANFSKCLRPLSGGAGAAGAIFWTEKQKSWAGN